MGCPLPFICCPAGATPDAPPPPRSRPSPLDAAYLRYRAVRCGPLDLAGTMLETVLRGVACLKMAALYAAGQSGQAGFGQGRPGQTGTGGGVTGSGGVGEPGAVAFAHKVQGLRRHRPHA